MIEGLVFEFESEELKKLLSDLGKLHEKKAEFFYKKVETSEEEPVPPELMSNRSVAGMKAHYADRLKSERNLASRFKFLSDHVIEKEIYRLTWEQIASLGLSDLGE